MPNPYLNLPRAVREELEPLVGSLVHDVGKYIARTARNVPVPRPGAPPEPLPAPLHRMLVRDLYGDERTRRPRAVFVELALPIARLVPDTRLVDARALLSQLELSEAAVRAADPAAVEAACAAAREIERLLRAIAEDAQRAFAQNQLPATRGVPPRKAP